MQGEPKELEEIRKKLADIDRKLDQTLDYFAIKHRLEPVPKTIASLPKHLRETALAVAAMGEATAEQVAEKTGRTRAAESDYLNQLANQDFLKRERRGREVFFRIFTLYTVCPKCGARVLITLDHCAMCGATLSPVAGKE